MRILVVAACAAALAASGAAASPVAAQVVAVAPDRLEGANRNLAAAMAANDRIVGLMTSLENPALETADSIEAFVAALDAMAPQVEAARAELRAIKARLEALPTVGLASDPVQVRATDQIVDDSAAFAGRAEIMLGSFPELADAFRAQDEPRMRRALAAVASSSITIIDGQALMLRGRVTMIGSDRSEYAQHIAMACMYEGMSHILQARMDLATATAAADGVAEAADCMTRQVATARTALARERATPNPNPALRPLETRMMASAAAALEQLDGAAQVMTSAEAAVRGGDGDMSVYLETFVQIEAVIGELGRDQVEAMAGQ